MLRRNLFIGGACLGVALMVSPALGQRSPASKANKFQATLVQGVEVCTAANTTAPGVLATPACDPVVPSDATCVFGPKGKGQVAAKEKKGDITVQAKLGGVDAGCEGETLCAVASITSSQDNCASSGDCTSLRPNTTDLPLGIACCSIEKGKCKIKTSVNVSLAGALVTGNRAEFGIGEVGLLRAGAPAPSNARKAAAFRTGLLLP